MRYPLDELLDKVSIMQLKFERIPDLEDKSKWINELRKYSQAIGIYVGEGICTREQVTGWFEELYKINGRVWDLEAAVRQGKDQELGYEEIGKRAIAVREMNKERISVKSKVVETTGVGYKDVKVNHASSEVDYKSKP